MRIKNVDTVRGFMFARSEVRCFSFLKNLFLFSIVPVKKTCLTWTEIRNLYIWFRYNVNRFKLFFSAHLWPKGFSKSGCQKKKSRKLCFKSKRKSWKSVSNCFRNLEIYWNVWNTSKPLKDFFFIKIGFIFYNATSMQTSDCCLKIIGI